MATSTGGTETTEPFRIAFVPGVTPDKWLRTWAARRPDEPIVAHQVAEPAQLEVLRDGSASMCFVRLPVDREGLHVIPLYHEVPVVVVSKEHPVAAFDEVDVTELADEALLQDPDTVPEWRDVAPPRDVSLPPLPDMTTQEAIAVVAAGPGIVIVPLSVARLYHRKDVVHRPVRGVSESQIGLAWRRDDDDPRIEVFVGIVRGRTERSSRGDAASAVFDDRGGAHRAAGPGGPQSRQPAAPSAG
ncbi:LysR family transcriptional regulator, partial [Intrasporangium oryzae NRRL B-24470]